MSKVYFPQRLQHQDMISSQHVLLTIANNDIPGSHKPAHQPVVQELFFEKGIENSVELQNNASLLSVENSTADHAAAADVPVCYANDINKRKKALDRKCKIIKHP